LSDALREDRAPLDADDADDWSRGVVKLAVESSSSSSSTGDKFRDLRRGVVSSLLVRRLESSSSPAPLTSSSCILLSLRALMSLVLGSRALVGRLLLFRSVAGSPSSSRRSRLSRALSGLLLLTPRLPSEGADPSSVVVCSASSLLEERPDVGCDARFLAVRVAGDASAIEVPSFLRSVGW
jgi:hypothetical protein